MDTLWLDLETFCDIPLKSHGAHRYAEKAEVMLASLAWDDAPVSVVDYTDGLPLDDLRYAIKHADRVVTHGSFDRIILAAQGIDIPLAKHDDNMVTALEHGMPGGLGPLCGALSVPKDEAKDKEGGKLISLFCSPTPKNWKIRRATKLTHPAEWARFVEYARTDIAALRAVHQRLPRWNCTPLERQYWFHDQACNALGMKVDLALARASLDAYETVKADARDEVHLLTGGTLSSVGQRDRMLKLLQTEYAWEGGLTKAALEKAMRGDIPPDLRALLKLRIKASAASPAKYKALIKATGSDGRLRDTIQFCGAARTGRDAGRIFQPQNLPRPSLPKAAIDIGIVALKARCSELLYDTSELVVSAVRGAITAAPGHKLMVADLSNIEGRVLAWLAGEEWKLEAFRANDRGEGEEIYILTAAGILGKPTSEVTKVERDRYGKVPELAGGFQGWVGAYRRMGGPKIEALSDEEIMVIAGGWRDRHPMIRRFWRNMEDTMRMAISNPTQTYLCGKIGYDMAKGPDGVDYLRMRLPSGRYLSYRQPTGGQSKCKVCNGAGVMRPSPDDPYDTCEGCDGKGSFGSDELGYHGINQTTYQWEAQTTYGGKATENGTQATARDVFFHGWHLAVQMGFRIVLRVHDELVAEVPLDSHLTLQDLINCLTTNPVWAPDLPLAAKGFEAINYYKD